MEIMFNDSTIRDTIQNKTILIVEDEENNYYFLHEVVSKFKANPIWAKNGQEAIDLIEKNNDVVLVLMDMKMPVMNGYEATRQIKKIRPDIPIIAQTAYAMPGERDQILEAGCDDYVSKPIVLNDLYEKIENLLKRFS